MKHFVRLVFLSIVVTLIAIGTMRFVPMLAQKEPYTQSDLELFAKWRNWNGVCPAPTKVDAVRVGISKFADAPWEFDDGPNQNATRIIHTWKSIEVFADEYYPPDPDGAITVQPAYFTITCTYLSAPKNDEVKISATGYLSSMLVVENFLGREIAKDPWENVNSSPYHLWQCNRDISSCRLKPKKIY